MREMTRRAFLVGSAGAVALLLAGCGEKEPPEPLDLTGAWTTRTEGADSWQELVIEGNSMRVEWVYDDGETRSLYWAGTYDAPDEATEEWAWTSENDHSATDVALLASTSDEKEFSYADGAISYEVSAMGTTTTLHATRQEAEE